jgi:hypothetical protein
VKTGGSQRRWLLPALSALLAAALGAAINFATDLKTSWVAWNVVAAIVIASVVVTVLLDRRHSADPVVRTEETEDADGFRTKTIECYSEEIAIRFFREDFGPDEGEDFGPDEE